MLGDAVRQLSLEELQSALAGLDLDASLSAEKLKPILLQTVAAGGAHALARVLGKNVVKKAALAIIEKYILKQLGAKATRELTTRIGAKIAATTFQRILPWIGYALLVKDVWDLAGEATRITTPLVTGISIGRTLSRLKEA